MNEYWRTNVATFSFQRVWGVILRHLYHFARNWDRWADSVYWPVMDLLIWGMTTSWMAKHTQLSSPLLLIMLTAIVFWQIVWRANYEISVNLLEEYWSRNLVNLFATPLKISEWVVAVMALGMLKNVITIVVGLIASWVIYSLNIFGVGVYLLPFLLVLTMSGWFMGFFASGLIILYGRKIQTIAWAMGFVFAPFSAVYYPAESLPNWAQSIAYALPMTYVFEGMRKVLSEQIMPFDYLIKGFVLVVVYLAIAICFFVTMFERSKKKGLSRLE